MKVYLLETGVLLDKNSRDGSGYSAVYDKEYGYFDEWQVYMSDYNKAVKEASDYVRDGVDNTYAIISETELNGDYTDEELGEMPVEDEEYNPDSVLFSLRKHGTSLVKGFIRGKKITEPEETKKAMFDLIENYFYDCEVNGHSEFRVWCEDNIGDGAQRELFEKLCDHVEVISDALFS